MFAIPPLRDSPVSTKLTSRPGRRPRSRRARRSGAAGLPALLLSLAAAAAQAQPPAWTQFGFDAQHSGCNDQETAINTSTVGTLHQLFQVTLPSVADGAPAYLPGVRTPRGIKRVLFLTTKDGRLLALDADNGSTLWSAWPASGPGFTTSSPAVDPNRSYVYSYGLDGKVHKYQVGDGTEIATGGWPEVATLKPGVEKGSSALTVATTPDGGSFLYVTNGGYPDDAGDYQGHVTAIDLATGGQHVFNTMCSARAVHFVEGGSPDCRSQQGAVWARPGVAYAPATGKIYFATGNGPFDAARGGHEWGDSVLAIHPDGTGAGGGPLDSYTPVNFQRLQDDDMDLGSTAPVILPTPAGSRVAHLAAHVGKDEWVRLLDLDNLSGAGSPGRVGGELQAVALPQGNQVLQQPAVWVDPVDRSTWLFIANFSGISALELVVDAAGNPALTPVWTHPIAGTSPVVANGILFYAAVGAGEGLSALDPRTGDLLWLNTDLAALHWESPIVVAGRLYMADESAVLRAYVPQVAPLRFHSLPACRAVDTRRPPGAAGGPALSGGGAPRIFQLAGQCGAPAGARAVAANLTVVRPTAAGDLRLGPSGVALAAMDPRALTVQFGLRRLQVGEPLLLLNGHPVGALAVQADLPAGATVGLILDVYGYYD